MNTNPRATILVEQKIKGTLSIRLAEIQARLAALNNEVRGRKIAKEEYRRICQEQAALKEELALVHGRLVAQNAKIQDLMALTNDTPAEMLERRSQNSLRMDGLAERLERVERLLLSISDRLDAWFMGADDGPHPFLDEPEEGGRA